MGLPGPLCPSGVFRSAGCWAVAAGSPWPPLRALGLSGQASATWAVPFFSSKPAKKLRENELPYGVLRGQSLLSHCTLKPPPPATAVSSAGGWGRAETVPSLGGPQHCCSLPPDKGSPHPEVLPAGLFLLLVTLPLPLPCVMVLLSAASNTLHGPRPGTKTEPGY